MTTTEAETAPQALTALYRAVGPSEWSDIDRSGGYGRSPNESGKYFGYTERGVRDFARAPFNAALSMTITRITVPQYFVAERGFSFNDPGGAGPSVFFEDTDLPDLYDLVNAHGGVTILGHP